MQFWSLASGRQALLRTECSKVNQSVLHRAHLFPPLQEARGDLPLIFTVNLVELLKVKFTKYGGSYDLVPLQFLSLQQVPTEPAVHQFQFISHPNTASHSAFCSGQL